MKNSAKVFFSLLAISFSGFVSAQTYSGYSEVTVQFRSDTSTKSVLLSNAKEDGVGDLSPFIGAASWYDLNKPLICRSLLSFDMGIMSQVIRPELITEAQLILKPYDPVTNTPGTKFPDNMQFFVRRVAEPWVDSLTSWQSQPAVSSPMEPNKLVIKNKKNPEVRIDVTETVRNMFRQGNNGFMITLREAEEAASIRTHYWFASARNEDEKLKPLLLVKFSYPSYVIYGNDGMLRNAPPFDNLPNRYSYHQTLTTPLPPNYNITASPPNVVPEPVNPPPPKSGTSNN